MFSRHEIQNLISGIGGGAKSNFIQAAARFLGSGKETANKASPFFKRPKSEEKSELIKWCDSNAFWINYIDETRYLAEGAEQRVFLLPDGLSVIKLNDAVFYECWIDYFNSLLLHNLFFPITAYELVGFHLEDTSLFSVVKQPYVQLTEETDLEKVRFILEENGFVNYKRHDYRNHDLGIILEDIHDENVLTSHGIPFFIDTVFYLTKDFYK